jgi:hypothetical protein
MARANAEDPDEYKAENVFWVPAKVNVIYAPNACGKTMCYASDGIGISPVGL